MIKEENQLARKANIIAWLPKYEVVRSQYLHARTAHRKFRQKHKFPLYYNDYIIFYFLNKQLKKFKKELKQILKTAINDRLSFLVDKIKLASDNDDRKVLKALRNIYKCET